MARIGGQAPKIPPSRHGEAVQGTAKDAKKMVKVSMEMTKAAFDEDGKFAGDFLPEKVRSLKRRVELK